MSDVTPMPESLRSTPTLESVCATPPPESPPTTPSPEPSNAKATAYYYISSKGIKMYPRTSSLTPYKPLPEGWDRSEGYWLYGWPANNRKLQALLPSYLGIPSVYNDPAFDSDVVLDLLEAESGYRHISRITGKLTEDAPEDALTQHPFYGRAIQVLVISCTVKRRCFVRRPTVKQLEVLKARLGEPRWFECVYTRKVFPLGALR